MTDTGLCTWCGETVELRDQHPSFHCEPMHRACGFRAIGGSVAHLEGRCSCYVPGSTEGDPPGMTRRQAAMAAIETFERINCCAACGAFLQGGATVHEEGCPIYPMSYHAIAQGRVQ